MLPITNKIHLQQYIAQVEKQKKALDNSTLFEPTELKVILETYDLQIQLASNKLNRINNYLEIKPGANMHTLVFGKKPASKSAYFQRFLDKKNAFECNNYNVFINSKCYLKNHEIISIFNLESIGYLQKLVSSDFIEITNIDDLSITRKIHAIPMIIGCNFPLSKLSDTIKTRCNIVELD